MKSICLLFPALLALSCVVSLAAAQEPRPELRAFWADAFNPGFKSPEEADQLLQRLHDAHCNAIFAQVRKRGDAYYRSHYEPWASDDPSHFDALAYLIQRAHQMKPPIAVHAWVNACAVGGDVKNPLNVIHLHPEWISLNAQNADYDGESTKIDPGNPDAADWTFRVYMDVIRHYDVDGIHFDFIRYGGKDWGYNPASVARFRQEYSADKDVHWLPGGQAPDPADPAWQQWRRDQVTNLVRKVYVHAAAVNPNVVVSAAVIAWNSAPATEEEWFTKSAAMTRVYQDWRGWLQEHIVDLACPMTYFRADPDAEKQRAWAEFVKDHQYGRAATVGVGVWLNPIADSMRLIATARETSAKNRRPYGVMLYSYSGTNASVTKDAAGRRQEYKNQPEFYAALAHPCAENKNSPPFPTDTPLPNMPWKRRKDRGHVKGFILTPSLAPVDGATVTLESGRKSLTSRTDGTGFYAFVDLPTGPSKLMVEASGYAPHRETVTVTGGKVASATMILGNAATPDTPGIGYLQGKEPGIANGLPVRFASAMVTLGSDTFPGNLYVADNEGRGMRVRLAAPPLVPFQRGDVVALVGTLDLVDGERTIDRATAALVDIGTLAAIPSTVVATGARLLSETALSGTTVRLQGKVTAAGPDGFTVDDGQPVRVVLAGLKEFGVEASGLAVAPPPVGSHVSVTGIAAVVLSPDGKTRTAVLRPRSAEDVAPLGSASAWPAVGAAGGAAAFFHLGSRVVRASKEKDPN